MLEQLTYTDKEIIELIMDFCAYGSGFLKDDIAREPAVKRFVDFGMTEETDDERYKDFVFLSQEGKSYLQDHINTISIKYIDYMKKCKYEQSESCIYEWFANTFKLDDLSSAKEIAEYICLNLGKYGYRAEVLSSKKRGSFVRISKM